MSYQENLCLFRTPYELDPSSKPSTNNQVRQICDLLMFDRNKSCKYPNLTDAECRRAKRFFDVIVSLKEPRVTQNVIELPADLVEDSM